MSNYIKKLTKTITKSTKNNTKSSKTNKTKTSTKKSSDLTNSKSTYQSMQNEVKKLPGVAKLAIIACFVVGIFVSFLGLKIICKNDCFKLNGSATISLSIGDSYNDLGVEVIAFGKDASDKVNVEVYKNNDKIENLDDIDTSEENVYQIVYTVSSYRFKNIQLIRTIYVENNSPEEDAYDD